VLHLEGGTVDLHDDNTVSIRELDIKWDKLDLCLGFDIPEICAGGWCIVSLPFVGCVLSMPEFCVFEGNPDIEFCLPVGGLITSEISITGSPLVKYFVDPSRTPAMSDLDAEDAGVPNKWQVFLDPAAVDIDVIDIADTLGDLLEEAVDLAIDILLSPFPGVVEDFVRAVLGPIIDLIRGVLDLPDDVGEWLTDLLGYRDSLGLFPELNTFAAAYFATNPLHEFEDPFPVLDADEDPDGVTLIPVKIPIEALTARVTDAELILEANVGA
jgi:hypothetical protein